MTQTTSKDNRESINEAGKLIDKFLKEDQTFYDLSGLLGVTTDSMLSLTYNYLIFHTDSRPSLSLSLSLSHTHTLEHANLSGHLDSAYPALSSSLPALTGMPFLGEIVHTPLPQELLQEFESILIQ